MSRLRPVPLPSPLPSSAPAASGQARASVVNRIRSLAEGEGFEPPKACTLVVFKATFGPSATVRGRSPTSALYFTQARFVHRRSPTFVIVRCGCRHGCRQGGKELA